MSEPEEAWEKRISDAILKAKAGGHTSIADYISLKSSNDAIRRKAVEWLLETVDEIVSAFNNRGARIEIGRQESHKFDHQNAHLTGSILKLQRGVRCLTFEAGWTRNPGDGFMRDGALALARIRHFGIPGKSEHLALFRLERTPQWFTIADERRRVSFEIDGLRRHFEVFLEVV